MRITLALFFLSLSSIIFAQDFEWAQKVGSFSSSQRFFESAVGLNNEIYLAGSFQGTFDLDPGPDQNLVEFNGIYDAIVVKFDQDGNLIWALAWGSEGMDEVKGIDVDINGNILVTGYFSGDMDANPGEGISMVSSEGSRDVFISKFSADGDWLWTNTLGDESFDEGNSITSDEEGNIYCTGYYEESLYVAIPGSPVNLSNSGSRDIFIVKMNEDGEYIWAQKYGSNAIEEAYSIHSDRAGHFYITGYYVSQIDFDPDNFVTNHAPGAPYFNTFIAKYTVDNELAWLKVLGGDDEARGHKVVTDSEGNVLTVGIFDEEVDFDPSPGTFNMTSQASNDIFISKLDVNGDFVWAKRLGNDQINRGTDIDVDSNDNIYVTGDFVGSMDLDPNAGEEVASSESNDGFFVKLTPDGEYQFSYNIARYIDGVSIGSNGEIYVAGVNDELQDFDPGAGVTELNSSSVFPDLFVAKFSQCLTTYTVDEQTSCGPFTWIDGVTYEENNNSATYTEMIEGCEFVTELDLEVVILDVSVTLTDGTLTTEAEDVSYQWLDCNDNFAEIDGATDAEFIPTETGNYAVEVTQEECSQTSSCTQVIISDIEDLTTSNSEFSLYPNPTSSEVFISVDLLFNELEVTVFDLTGRKITSQTFNAQSQLNILLPEETGVYLVSLSSNGNLIGQKRVVVR